MSGSAASTAERPYDLVLLGATGFTGRLTARHLARQLQGTSTRWAIAGRDGAKLAAVQAELGGGPEIEVVDVGDLVGLLDLSGRTRALATTVGPFARHGEPVVQACVRSGTHYADITGEPGFVRLIRDRYHANARRRGVTIVSCCGFESVPADLGVGFTVAHLPDDAPIDVRGYVRAVGRLSGGTAHTALEAVASRQLPRAAGWADAGGAGEAEDVDEAEDADEVKDAGGTRPVALLPRRLHRIDALGAWAVPMPTLDTEIVLRSARVLDGYGSAFRYGHYARVGRLRTAAAGAAGLGAFAAAAAFAPTRRLVGRALPSPGEGPSAEVRARSRFTLTFVATGGDQEVITRVSGGDPGYEATAIMLGEAVRCLAGQAHAATQAAGVVTPAMALGGAYRQRLHAHGVRFELAAQRPRT